MSNYFRLEKAASDRTSCSRCGRQIALGSLRVKKKGKLSHLRCFRPPLVSPIIVNRHVSLYRLEDDSADLATVRRWIDRWNAKFIVTEETIPEKFRRKAVTTVQSSDKRALLHIFAFLSAKSVECEAAFVCKNWFHVSREAELWKSRFLAEFQPPETEEGADYRRKYITDALNSCWKCKKRVSLDLIRRRCPYFNRPLCLNCSWKRECHAVSMNAYLSHTYIKKSLVKTLNFPTFIEQKRKSSYASLLCKAMLPYAEKRRKLLIAMLTEEEHKSNVAEETIEEVRNFDLQQFYTGGFDYPASKATKSIAVFCGQDENTENPQKSVRVFIESLP